MKTRTKKTVGCNNPGVGRLWTQGAAGAITGSATASIDTGPPAPT